MHRNPTIGRAFSPRSGLGAFPGALPQLGWVRAVGPRRRVRCRIRLRQGYWRTATGHNRPKMKFIRLNPTESDCSIFQTQSKAMNLTLQGKKSGCKIPDTLVAGKSRCEPHRPARSGWTRGRAARAPKAGSIRAKPWESRCVGLCWALLDPRIFKNYLRRVIRLRPTSARQANQPRQPSNPSVSHQIPDFLDFFISTRRRAACASAYAEATARSRSGGTGRPIRPNPSKSNQKL
jgi:hypothetical protein